MSKVKYECGVLGCETDKVIECTHCKYISCIKCTQMFILSQSKAECMSCHKEYDEQYLRQMFPSSWMKKEYTGWKKAKLIEREKGYLPETVDYIEREKNKTTVQKEHFKKKIELVQIEADIKQMQTNLKIKKNELKIIAAIDKNREKVRKQELKLMAKLMADATK